MTLHESNPRKARHAPAAAGAQRRRVSPLPDPGSLQDLLRVMGVDAVPTAAEHQAIAASLWRIRRHTVLFHEGDRSPYLYVVRSGSLKCAKTLEDGYEQVLSFAQVGELLGFESLHGGRQPYGAMALEDSTVYVLPTPEVRDPQRRGALLDEALHNALADKLMRAAETAEMMSAVASDARLARFILWLSERMAQAGQSRRRLRLHMGRRDIASLLGVAHETVSRSFTTLAECGLIGVDIRDVEILDFDGLGERARATRGPTSNPASTPASAATRTGPARAAGPAAVADSSPLWRSSTWGPAPGNFVAV
jgi:CRP/FNR family transcriptional regulator, anaerobic regulatory protein